MTKNIHFYTERENQRSSLKYDFKNQLNTANFAITYWSVCSES